MKIRLPHQLENASVLVMTLTTSIVIGLVLASTVTIVAFEHGSVNRDQAWNRSLVVTEAGVEDGLAYINAGGNWTNGSTSNHWSVSGNTYSMTRTLGSDTYTVWITNTATPSVRARGTAVWHGQYGNSNAIQRGLLVTTTTSSSLNYALLMSGDITLSGTVLADSWNSANGAYSASKRDANGGIATNTKVSNPIIGSGTITVYGTVNTGGDPPLWSGTVTIGPTNEASGHIAAGYEQSNLNVTIPNAPTAPTAPTYLGMPTLTNSTYIFRGLGAGSTNYYQIPAGETISGSTTFLVTNGPVVLDFLGSFTSSGTFAMNIATNSSLVAYLNGSTTISGTGVVNPSDVPANCIFYGSTNCTAITESGSSAFYGVFDCPSAAFTYSGTSGFYGAILGKTFTASGGGQFHYDEALSASTTQTYVIASYSEVSPP